MSFAAQRYQAAQVETASPVRIVVQLHDGAVRSLQQAITLTQPLKLVERAAVLKKGHAIIAELQASLEAKHSPELCRDLDRLYDFMLERITKATLSRDIDETKAALAPVIAILRELRGAWATVAEKQP
jgi:flagellar secretion chaperone FliS